MGSATHAGDRPVALVAFDGSPAAAEPISIGARLLPAATARIVCVWTPPLARADLRRRLLRRARNIDELIALIEREGASEAERLADQGGDARASAGRAAEPLIHRSHAGEGFELAACTKQKASPQSCSDVYGVVVGFGGEPLAIGPSTHPAWGHEPTLGGRR